jgi:hypothetical protein
MWGGLLIMLHHLWLAGKHLMLAGEQALYLLAGVVMLAIVLSPVAILVISFREKAWMDGYRKALSRPDQAPKT